MFAKYAASIGPVVRDRGILPEALSTQLSPQAFTIRSVSGALVTKVRYFDNDGVDIFPRSIVLSAVDEAVIAFLVFLELIALPGPLGPAGDPWLNTVSQLRVRRIEAKRSLPSSSISGFGIGNSCVRHGQWKNAVIELGRVIDRAEEPRQIVKEGVVSSADEHLDGIPACFDCLALVGCDYLREASGPEPQEPDSWHCAYFCATVTRDLRGFEPEILPVDRP